MNKGSHHTQTTRNKMRRHNKCRSTDHVQSFWNRVDKNGPIPAHLPDLGPCWNWTGGLTSGKFKYGVLNVAGKSTLAHRFAYELEHGQIPEGKSVLHSCDNCRCVRHLFLGTRIENNLDRDRKRRQAHGERNSHAKLTAAEIDTLRWTYKIGGVSQATLGRWYGIKSSAVSMIVNNKNWRLPLVA
jgi:hypothetical protein